MNYYSDKKYDELKNFNYKDYDFDQYQNDLLYCVYTIDDRPIMALKDFSHALKKEYKTNINILTPMYFLIKPYKNINNKSKQIIEHILFTQ